MSPINDSFNVPSGRELSSLLNDAVVVISSRMRDDRLIAIRRARGFNLLSFVSSTAKKIRCPRGARRSSADRADLVAYLPISLRKLARAVCRAALLRAIRPL